MAVLLRIFGVWRRRLLEGMPAVVTACCDCPQAQALPWLRGSRDTDTCPLTLHSLSWLPLPDLKAALLLVNVLMLFIHILWRKPRGNTGIRGSSNYKPQEQETQRKTGKERGKAEAVGRGAGDSRTPHLPSPCPPFPLVRNRGSQSPPPFEQLGLF